MPVKRYGPLVLLLLTANAQAGAAEPPPAACPAAPSMSGEFAPQGIDVSSGSRTSHPGDDFFAYVDEGWVKRTPIPGDHWDYGQTDILGAKVDAKVKALVMASATDPSPRGSPARRSGPPIPALPAAGPARPDMVRIVRQNQHLERDELRWTQINADRRPSPALMFPIKVIPI